MTISLGLSSVALASAPASEQTPEVIARRCDELGLDAVELRPDYLEAQPLPPSGVARIFRSHGVRLVYATGTVFADNREAPAAARAPLRLDFAVAHILGAEILRIFPGDLARLGAEAVALARAWGEFAAAEGRCLVLENTGDGPGSDPLRLADFLRDSGSGLFLNFDVGNAARAGFDPAATMAQVRDITAMLHLKDFSPQATRGVDAAPGSGIVDFAAVGQALAGWSGLACFEVNAGTSPWDAVEEWINHLRSLGFSDSHH